MSPQQIVQSILEQINARGIIKEHLRYCLHRDTISITVTIMSLPKQPDIVAVHFEAVVSADYRQEGAFRWPPDDCWVRVIGGSLGITEKEILSSRSRATQILLARVNLCGETMREMCHEWPEENSND